MWRKIRPIVFGTSFVLVALLTKIATAFQKTELPAFSKPNSVMHSTSKPNYQELATYQAYRSAIAQTWAW